MENVSYRKIHDNSLIFSLLLSEEWGQQFSIGYLWSWWPGHSGGNPAKPSMVGQSWCVCHFNSCKAAWLSEKSLTTRSLHLLGIKWGCWCLTCRIAGKINWSEWWIESTWYNTGGFSVFLAQGPLPSHPSAFSLGATFSNNLFFLLMSSLGSGISEVCFWLQVMGETRKKNQVVQSVPNGQQLGSTGQQTYSIYRKMRWVTPCSESSLAS
jgi:hypothetical protein